MKFSNKGLSYIELVLALGIGAVLLTFVTFSVSTVSNNNASKGAKRLQSAFSTAKITSMAKGKDAGRLFIVVTDNKAVYYIGKNNFENKKNGNVICTKPCYLRFDFNGVDYYPVAYGGASEEVFAYSFEPTTGAIGGFELNPDVSAGYNEQGYKYSKWISVQNKHGNEFDVKIYPDTGNTEVK